MNSIKIYLLISTIFVTAYARATDDFQWLKDDSRTDLKVKGFLEAKNNVANAYLSNLKSMQDELITEWQLNSPSKADKPWRIHGGKEFQLITLNEVRVIVSRDRGAKKHSVLLNIEQRAEQSSYYHLGAWSISPNGRYIALAEDRVGNENYQVTVVHIQKQQEINVASAAESLLIWSTDSEKLYTINNENGQNHGSSSLIENTLHSKSSSIIFQNDRSGWLLSAYLSSGKNYAIVQINNESSTEQRALNLNTGELSAPLLSYQKGVEYYSDIAGKYVYINSNHEGSFALYRYLLNATTQSLELVYQPKPGVDLDNFYLFESGIAIVEQLGGIKSLAVKSYVSSQVQRHKLTENGVVAWVSNVGDFNSDTVRIRSMSMIQPPRWEELNIRTGMRSMLSEDHYPNYQQEKYQTQQVMVKSGNVEIPITLAFKKDLLTKTSPVVLYGYGAYGFTMKPYFMPQVTSLLDRGIIYAVAHVRGGGYFGPKWHFAGKGENRLNSINDFIHAAEKMTQFANGNRKVAAMGSSAGGTLVAAALNQDPKLFSAASLNVPFVDVISSMSDTSLPLTSQQYQEWGNPNNSNDLSIMSAYDPVLNIKQESYPPIMVRVGWQDIRVPYWEGAKYLSLVSQKSNGEGPYLLLTDFNSGHATDRRRAIQQQAMDYAFLIKQLFN